MRSEGRSAGGHRVVQRSLAIQPGEALDDAMRAGKRGALSLIISILAAALGLAACSATGGSRAQQEQASLNKQLQTPGSGASIYGEEAEVGAVEPTVAWVVGSPRTVTVLRASLFALPGFKLPRLVGLGVVPGCAGSDNMLEASTNEQDQVEVTGNGHPLRPLPLKGYRMRTGDAKCAPAFVYTVLSTLPGDYAAGGLRLTVQAGSQTQTVLAYDGVFVWYYAYGAAPSNDLYNQRWNAASSAEDELYNEATRQ